MKEPVQDPEISRRPTINYDPEIEIDGVVEVQFGSIVVWFTCTTDGDLPIAFEIQGSGSGRVCCEVQEEWPELIREVASAWKGYRCAAVLSPEGFAKAWHANVDPYLFPKKKGRISVEVPLGPDTPSEIVADWLQDKGLEKIAQGVRAWRDGEDHKGRHEMLHQHLDELVADYINHSRRLPSDTSVMELIQWSHAQTQNPTELK